MTGFRELDSLIARDLWVEFYSEDADLLVEFYSRVIALSSYPSIKVLVIAERGGLDPWKIRSYQRIFGVDGKVLIRRAFKAEDVPPSVEAMGDGNLIVINPYGFFRLYSEIVGALRKRRVAKTFVFSPFDRERRGSIFGLHSAHSIVKLERGVRGIRFKLVKSPNHGEVELTYPIQELFGKESVGLELWL
jgi:hypothetical protein